MTVGDFKRALAPLDDSAEVVTADGLPLHIGAVSCGVVWLSDIEDTKAFCRTCRQPILDGTDLVASGRK
jgi:hypothetical protein